MPIRQAAVRCFFRRTEPDGRVSEVPIIGRDIFKGKRREALGLSDLDHEAFHGCEIVRERLGASANGSAARATIWSGNNLAGRK